MTYRSWWRDRPTALAGIIGVRDSEDPAGQAFAFDPAAWTRFLVLAKRD
ncbi:DUF397 domain-containing protein [Micromonospora sp. NPDC127501]